MRARLVADRCIDRCDTASSATARRIYLTVDSYASRLVHEDAVRDLEVERYRLVPTHEYAATIAWGRIRNVNYMLVSEHPALELFVFYGHLNARHCP